MPQRISYPANSAEFFMAEAMKEAEIALQKNEVPIGAVIVCGNRIIARAHNLTETLNDVTAHAEMQAFTTASDWLGGKYLNECILYVTLEPCVMCAGAAYWTQLGKLVYGADDEKRGYRLIHQKLLHPNTEVLSGVLANECSQLLKDFFKKKKLIILFSTLKHKDTEHYIDDHKVFVHPCLCVEIKNYTLWSSIIVIEADQIRKSNFIR